MDRLQIKMKQLEFEFAKSIDGSCSRSTKRAFDLCVDFRRVLKLHTTPAFFLDSTVQYYRERHSGDGAANAQPRPD
jgi:hypothetical protein